MSTQALCRPLSARPMCRDVQIGIFTPGIARLRTRLAPIAVCAACCRLCPRRQQSAVQRWQLDVFNYAIAVMKPWKGTRLMHTVKGMPSA